jgi:hypothetical protein
VHQAVEAGALGPRLLHRVAHHHEAGRQDLEVVGVAPDLHHAAAHVLGEAAPVLDASRRAEDHLGGLGGELAPRLGGAGLHDHRPALDRPGDVEGSAHREVGPAMVEHVHPVGVEEDPALDVAQEGIVGERVPQALHHRDEFVRPVVAVGVLGMVREPEVPRRVGVRGRHHVPARPAAAEVVEGGEAPGDVVRLVVGGGRRGDEPDALRHHRERGQQRRGVERGHGGRALERLDRHVQHREVVGHEEGVELRRLEGLGEAREMGEVEVGVRVAARVAPPGGVDADRAHEGAEVKPAVSHDDGLL